MRLYLFAFFFIIPLSFLTFSCKSNPSTLDGEVPTILVQMFDDASVSALEENYAMYGLHYKKVVSKPMHIYIFEFSTEKITAIELIELLKKSDLVKETQQNRNVKLRN